MVWGLGGLIACGACRGLMEEIKSTVDLQKQPELMQKVSKVSGARPLMLRGSGGEPGQPGGVWMRSLRW